MRVCETVRQKNSNRWSLKTRNWAMVEQVVLNLKHSQKKVA